MRSGFVVAYGDAKTVAELAEAAEEHGWDAIFCWESIWGIDPWISLTAAAMRTSRIRLGTMLNTAATAPPVGAGQPDRHARQPFERPRGSACGPGSYRRRSVLAVRRRPGQAGSS